MSVNVRMSDEQAKKLTSQPDNWESVHNVKYTFGIFCMLMGMNNLTPANRNEWLIRLRIYQGMNGGMGMSPAGGNVTLDAEWLDGYMGVSTNVPPETFSKWMKYKYTCAMRDLVQAERQKAQAAEKEKAALLDGGDILPGVMVDVS